MRVVFCLFLTGCASLMPDTYLSPSQFEFCTNACKQYGGLGAAGKTLVGDKKSCICKNNTNIDYESGFHSEKLDKAKKADAPEAED